MFLTETLGWREGIDRMKDATSGADPNDFIKLAKYLFLTEQMRWRKGLKLFGERGELAVEGKLQQIHDMEGFQPKHWYELTKEERKRHSTTSCISRRKEMEESRAEDVLKDDYSKHTPKR